jgi:hypothetical protein
MNHTQNEMSILKRNLQGMFTQTPKIRGQTNWTNQYLIKPSNGNPSQT